jgi:hypothetical protein
VSFSPGYLRDVNISVSLATFDTIAANAGSKMASRAPTERKIVTGGKKLSIEIFDMPIDSIVMARS